MPSAEPTLRALNDAVREKDPAASARALKDVMVRARELFAVNQVTDPDWFPEFQRAIDWANQIEITDDGIEALLLCAQWYLKDGQPPLAVLAAEKAVDLAERSDNLFLLRRCYSLLGNMHNGSKDYVQATVCYARAVEIARSIDDRVGECASIANLAAARLHSGLLEESRKLNALVIEMAEVLEKRDPRLTAVKQQAQHNVALASLLLGDLYIGRTHIEDAVHHGPEPKTQFEAYQRVLMEYTYVRILSKDTSGYETARERAGVARKYADQAQSAPASLQANLAETACDVNDGRWDIALSRLKRFLDSAKGNDPIKRDVMDAMVDAYRRSGDMPSARRVNRDYLESHSRAQRAAVKAQLDTIKKSFRLPPAETAPSVLPPSVLEKVRDRDRKVWVTFREKLEAMAVLAELRDDATGEHAFRVGRLSGIFAQALGHDERFVETIEMAARLHDIGKLVIPDVILQKRGKLLEEEFDIMKRHTGEGAAILRDVNHDSLHPAIDIAMHHHEWWDGNGYPSKLSGEEIPLQARITSLVDVFDALSHKRPYKPAWEFDRCVTTIRELRGQQFDPELTDHFLDLLADLRSAHGDALDQFLGQGAGHSALVNANRLIDRIVSEHRSLTF